VYKANVKEIITEAADSSSSSADSSDPSIRATGGNCSLLKHLKTAARDHRSSVSLFNSSSPSSVACAQHALPNISGSVNSITHHQFPIVSWCAPASY
jgi:hypothetical protein